MINWSLTREEMQERGREVNQIITRKEYEIKALQGATDQLEAELVLLRQEYWGHYRILANMDYREQLKKRTEHLDGH